MLRPGVKFHGVLCHSLRTPDRHAGEAENPASVVPDAARCLGWDYLPMCGEDE